MRDSGRMIQDTVCRVGEYKSIDKPLNGLNGQTGSTGSTDWIQDQSILTMAFIATAKFEYSILCNYREKIDYNTTTPFAWWKPVDIYLKVIFRHPRLSIRQRFLGKFSDADAMRWFENLYD